MKKILIVDDDIQICELLKDFLTRHHYKVFIANNGREMQSLLKKYVIDMIILDIMMPGADGLTLCKNLRTTSNNVPIIILSAMGDETERIVGLEIGADDYLAKPFNPRELLARIKALSRRATGEFSQKPIRENIKFDQWTLDHERRCLTDNQNFTIPLSQGEYQLLMIFLKHPNRILNRDQLLDLSKGKSFEPFDRSIDVQISRLRKKIEQAPKDPKIIRTIRGGGYQMLLKNRRELEKC